MTLYDIKTGLKNLWLFRRAVWYFRDWDHSGLVLLIEIATREMRDCHRYRGHLKNSPRYAKQLAVVSELCRRMREEPYYDFASARWPHQRWNEPHRPELEKSSRFWAEHICYLEKQDAEYFGKMMRFIRHWWD